MKTSLATMLSVTGVLAAGALAFAVNTSVLDHAVTTSEAAPTLQADVVSLSNLAPIGATAPAAGRREVAARLGSLCVRTGRDGLFAGRTRGGGQGPERLREQPAQP